MLIDLPHVRFLEEMLPKFSLTLLKLMFKVYLNSFPFLLVLLRDRKFRGVIELMGKVIVYTIIGDVRIEGYKRPIKRKNKLKSFLPVVTGNKEKGCAMNKLW